MNAYLDLAMGVQAVRRSVEREVGGLGGATGVAAVPYPHQLANVQRILTDTRIRHLIADEVGLGKTIQALMVLNALRIQSPDHRTLILVPENLAPQWWKECRARGHIVPVDEPPPEEGTGAHVRLVYYEQLGSALEIDPNLYDLLIVDEIQRLQATARQRIADTAGDFRQLLLLSATPRLDDVEAYRQLLATLEPERMAMAARSSEQPEQTLRDRERLAAELLRQGSAGRWEEAGFPAPPERERAAAVATTYSTVRRVTQTRRRDFPDLLPQRELNRVPVEPTDDEVRRQEQVWNYIGFAKANSASVDLARLGQVAIRSPRALSERINILRGRDQRDPHGYLKAAMDHLDPANGDSRLEALIDLLAGIWANDPEEPILIVAEDNPTVDYLERQVPLYLPEIGPRGARRPLSLAVKRNRDSAATASFIDLVDEYETALGGFVDGEQQLLIAANIAQVGLNLQHARKLIFFSIPWSPTEVEQWIGRLDRLGSAALLEASGERTIDIYALYQRGQVDERVVSVLDEFAVFKRSIRLDGEEIRLVAGHIEDAALDPHSVSWEKLTAEARDFSRDDDEDNPLETPLSPHLPWSALHARKLAAYYEQSGVIEPVIGRTRSRRAVLRSEAGLRGWMRLMNRADQIRLWGKRDPDDPDFTFRLMHYPRPAFAAAVPDPRFLLPGLEPKEAQRYAYLDSRHCLQWPPVETVNLPENSNTPLEFLDHGNPVHEGLLANWSSIGKLAPSCQHVSFPPGHPLAAPEAAGAYLVAVATWVAGRDHFQDFDAGPLIARVAETQVKQEQKPFLDAIKLIDDALRADRRWLTSLFTPRLDILAARLRDGAWELVDEATANALFTPWLADAGGRELQLALGRKGKLTEELKASAGAGGRILAAEQAKRHQRTLTECAHFNVLLAARRYQATVEADDLVRIRQAELDDAASLEQSEQGFARSRYRMLRNRRDAAIVVRDARLARLDGIAANVATARFQDYRTAILLVGQD